MEWIDALSHLPAHAIEMACRAWASEPVAVKGFKPVPAQILALAVRHLPKRSPAQIEREQEERLRLEAPERQRITPERMAEIAAEMGASHLFAGHDIIKRMPPAGSIAYPPITVEVPRAYTPEEIDAESREIFRRPYSEAELAQVRRDHGILDRGDPRDHTGADL